MNGLFQPKGLLGPYERARPGSAEEAAEFIRKNFKASGAFAFFIPAGGQLRSSYSGVPSVMAQLPMILRQLAAEYEEKLRTGVI